MRRILKTSSTPRGDHRSRNRREHTQPTSLKARSAHNHYRRRTRVGANPAISDSCLYSPGSSRASRQAVIPPEHLPENFEGANVELVRLLIGAMAEISEGVVITDGMLDGKGPRIVFVNAAFTRITGYTPEEAVGKTPRILQGPRTDRDELTRLRRELTACNHFHGQTINYRKDGRPFLMDWKIAPIRDHEGKVTHYVGIQRDVTAEYSEQQSQQQSQRMEAIGRVTGEIAHDFNNLLMGISGLAETIYETVANPDATRTTARELLDTTDRAIALTKQLLSFTRIQKADRRDIDLRELLSSIHVLLRRLAGNRIVMNIVVPEHGCTVRAASTELEQILINLVTNARDAMPDGGVIRIHVQPRLLDEHETNLQSAVPGNYVVSDTGVGMDESTRSRIFEPFFTTKPEGKGTGMGLTSVQGHVKRLHGVITVQSEVQKGSNFKVCIPASLRQ